MNEERAIVLDFLPQGKSSSFKPEPLAIVLGMSFFTLLEVAPKANVSLAPEEEVYIGKMYEKKWITSSAASIMKTLRPMPRMNWNAP
jgi:predicted nucleic acid-binding OB-fold protein